MSNKNVVDENAKVTLTVKFIAVSFIIAGIATLVGYSALLLSMKERINENRIIMEKLCLEIKHLKEFQAEVTRRVEAEFGSKLESAEKVQKVEQNRIEQKSDLKDEHIREINDLKHKSMKELFEEKIKNIDVKNDFKYKSLKSQNRDYFRDNKRIDLVYSHK